jgi:hypothetical protein
VCEDQNGNPYGLMTCGSGVGSPIFTPGVYGLPRPTVGRGSQVQTRQYQVVRAACAHPAGQNPSVIMSQKTRAAPEWCSRNTQEISALTMTSLLSRGTFEVV